MYHLGVPLPKFLRSYPLYFALISLILVSVAMLWHTRNTIDSFERYHNDLATHAVRGAARSIELYLRGLQTNLELFVESNQQLITALANNTDNEDIHARISVQLNRFFPPHQTFSISDYHGNIVTDEFYEWAGEMCRTDLQSFIQVLPEYTVLIHPGPNRPHFDIMHSWLDMSAQQPITQGVFFISFNVDPLAEILLRNEIPGHHLYLLRQDTDHANLIELSSRGSRDQFDGNNFLTAEQSQSIISEATITGTKWQLVDIPTVSNLQRFRSKTIMDNSGQMAAFTLFVIIMMTMILRQEHFRLLAEKRAANEGLKMRSILNTAMDGVITIDQYGTIEQFNPAATHIFGFAEAEVIGQNVSMLMPPAMQAQHDGQIQNAVQGGGSRRRPGVSVEQVACRKDGSLLPIGITLGRFEIEGEVKFVSIIRDISDRVATEKELRRLALTDPLTGLANRNQFNNRLLEALHYSQRFGHRIGLMMLDLDDFKHINDTHGHPTGDAVLIHISRILMKSFRNVDTVVRLGGDEFAVILYGVKPDYPIASTAEQLLRQIAIPYQLTDKQIPLGGSLGFSFMEPEDINLEALIQRADEALYLAKQRGKGNYVIHGAG